MGITRRAPPSMVHSSVVRGPIRSFRRIGAGIETCPRWVTRVRTSGDYRTDRDETSGLPPRTIQVAWRNPAAPRVDGTA
jgi:hypothetical protein